MADSAFRKIQIQRDDTTFDAYVVGKDDAPGIVVIQEWWGVDFEIKNHAIKISQLEPGFKALIPDLYRGKVGLDTAEAQHLMDGLDWPGAIKDIRASVNWLKSNGSKKVGVTGMCMGGALAIASSVLVPEVDAVVGFYGTPSSELADPAQANNPLKVSIYGEHAYPATVARYSPNGEWIASGDVSGTVRIWGAYNDHVLKNEFKVLAGRIDDLQWSADGMRIVASGDGKGKSLVRAFMWDSGSNVGEFDGHSRRVLSCAIKPTRPFRIVTCGEDFLVNFYEGPPFKFKLSSREHSNFVNCVRFAPDGSKFITVSSDKKGIIYDGKTCEILGELSSDDGHKGSIYAVSWSPDGKQVLTVSADKSAKIWDISDNGSGSLNTTLNCPGSSGGVDDMLVGCLWQNDHIVTVSLGGTISIFSASDLDKSPFQFSGHMKNVSSLAVLKGNADYILSGSYDGLICKWMLGRGFCGKLQRTQNSQIKCFAAHEEEIVTSGYDNKISRISYKDDQCTNEESIDIGNQPKDLSLAPLSPDLLLVTFESGVVFLRDGKVVSTINLGFIVTALAVTPDGTEAVIGGQDGKLHLYSINGDSLTEEAVLERHRGAISVIRYSPDLSMFASADLNREAVVWDRVSREMKLKNMLYHSARINCLAWSPNSTMVATGSLDTCVIVYEVDKPASSRMTIKGAHLGGVYGLGFADDSHVVSSGEDACIRVWSFTPQ